MKGNGYVVGGKAWEMKDKKGFSYRVLMLEKLNASTKMYEAPKVVNVSTESKQYEPAIKVGDFVEFDGEFKAAYGDSPAKMSYTGMRVVKK